MQVSGLRFTKAIIGNIGHIIKAEPSISRRELSRRLCETYGWRSLNGNLKDMSCRKALKVLDRQGVIALPAVQGSYAFARRRSVVDQGFEVPEVRCALEELGEVVVRPVGSRYGKDAKTWRYLLDCYHYLESGPLCGAQLRYLVESSIYGPLGALAFSSASFSVKARDLYIGWSEAAKRANLARVVNNARMVIAPSVEVKNLASHVLAQALRRLPLDWEERYNIRPLLVETYVDPTRFSGTLYSASNFVLVGETSGRRDGVRRSIFLRELEAEWRERLCQPPPDELGSLPRPEDPATWAEEEFGTVRFHDKRLKARLYTLAEDFYKKSEASIPDACGSKARTMAAYRFFKHKAVTMQVLLDAHTEATLDRVREHRIVLAPQDTTTLDYSTHPMTEDLGPTNTKADASIGLFLHDTVAFTPEGTPLGVLDAQCWARDPEDRGKSRRKHLLPIEAKESVKWLRSFRRIAELQRLCPNTTLVSIGDRESDIYELLLEAAQDPAGPRLLVRSDRARQRRVAGEEGDLMAASDEGPVPLWDYMAACEVAKILEMQLPRRGKQKSRKADVALRFAEVRVLAPKSCGTYPPVTLWAVYLLEEDPDEDVTNPIEWMLLTTVPVNTWKDAKERVEWYSARWGIEVYHRVLKHGCRIRDRQLGTADRLEACLGVDMVIAWRIYHLTMLGRETPEVPCTVFFEDVEWKTLFCLVSKNPVPPEEPPTIKAAVRAMGQLGGHLGRKGDGPPGTKTLWRGYQKLGNAVEMARIYRLYDSQPRPP